MSFHGAQDFANHKKNLAALLISTVDQYAAASGLQRLDRTSLSQMSASFNEVAAESLMFGCNAWPVSARPEIQDKELTVPFEVAASEVDPPALRPALFWTLLVLPIALPLGGILHHFFGVGDYFTIAFGVLTVSLFFGQGHALALSALSHLLHNFLIIPPIYTFTWPTHVEITMGLFCVIVAIATPWLASKAQLWKIRDLARSPISSFAN